MNPQGTAVSPQPTTVSPQGVASVTPNAVPVAPALPQAPTVVASPGQVATPNFNTAQTLGQIADYYNIPRQTAAITGAGQAQGAVAGQQFESSKYQNQIKIQNERDQLDPTKYQFTKNPDGSVDILNSVGDKVDIGTYASLTGANPADALKKAGATDEASQKFMAAYTNLQTFIQNKIAAQNGDEQAVVALGEFYKANPGLQNVELGQLQSAFMQQYGKYFGQPEGNSNALGQLGNAGQLSVAGSAQPNNVSPTLASHNSYTAGSPYYAAQAYGLTGESNPYASSVLGGGGTSPSSLYNQLQSQLTQGQ